MFDSDLIHLDLISFHYIHTTSTFLLIKFLRQYFILTNYQSRVFVVAQWRQRQCTYTALP